MCHPELTNNLLVELNSSSGGQYGLYHMNSYDSHFPIAYRMNLFYVAPVATGDGAYIYRSSGNSGNINVNNYNTTSAQTVSFGTQLLMYVNSYWSNIVNQDPLFVNAAGGDYRLQPGSPAAVAGINSLSFTTDRNGNPRTIPWSIGAYERD